ncbi:hypothetical protein HF329_23440 [Chitinophaga oryzae]|uniref:Uncharacterized protein n=1 Tax=Chitinophaga oryzae TaxID=2725414 RepID=A0AAE7D9P9_9BACT|nr:hypothetical protein [Chitinophaga oryzae]QJB34080.1 hypothetical protein HF329_23440 [Chitinophaga oryzae]
MEEIELIFHRAGILLKDLTAVAKSLQDMSKQVYTGSHTLADLTANLHGGQPDAYQKLFTIERASILRDLKKQIRQRLLVETDDNLHHNFLFLLLKLYTELRYGLKTVKLLQQRNAAIFDEQVSTNYKSRLQTIEIIPDSLPLTDLGQLVTLAGFYLMAALDLPKAMLRTIRQEFCLKADEVKALFDRDTNGTIPVNLHRLKRLLSQPSEPMKVMPYSYLKIPWAGNLKQFAELVTELEKKGWIKPIAHGELQATITTLLHCFDLSSTQRKEDSNTAASLLQYMKPSERDVKIYTKRYSRQFSDIQWNLIVK